MDAQHWNNYIATINDTGSKETCIIQNDTEIKQIYQFNKCKDNKLSAFSSENMNSLHDPYDINHIHGLRNRLFKTFNEFANILENALLPPVLKNPKKVQIKLNECDQQANYTNIVDLNSLISEIKNESKDENLYDKKNKANMILRKSFQIKLIQCYKLIINTTKICSKTLEAGIYNPIQSKMKKLIQIISSLSFITGKYIYGELFKKKKKESFDLVQRCKDIRNMLDECGYKDSENEDHSKNIAQNTLKELAKKAALNKTKKCPSNSLTSNRLQMYDRVKPKLGTQYAQEWTKKLLELSKNKDITNEYYNNNCKNINGRSVSLKGDNKFNFDVLTNHNLDNIETAIQEHPFEEYEQNNTLFCKEIDTENLVNIDKTTNSPTTSEILKTNKLRTTNNVGLYIIQENIWRNFPIKNTRLSQNGCIILNVTPNNINVNCLYKRQFKQLSIASKFKIDTITNITESIIKDLINEVLSKFNTDAIIDKLIQMELLE